MKGGFEIFNKGFLLIYKGIKKTSKAKVIAANAQGQAHLQFAQSQPANLKLQKSLPFLPPALIHSATLKGLKDRQIQNKAQHTTRAHTPLGFKWLGKFSPRWQVL